MRLNPMALPHIDDRKRRHFLAAGLQAGLAMAASGAWAQDVAVRPAGTGRLVVVFLRGAYDGLSALVPYGDADYYRLRPNIAIAAPDGTPQAALKLDTMFGLHPAMSPILPLWQQGVLAAIPCAGSPDPTRSHFDAQHHWEVGVPGRSGGEVGWLNTLAGLLPASVALGVGEANPFILAGSSKVQLIPRGLAATRQGALGDPRTRQAILKLYEGQDALSSTFRSGAESRMQTARTLAAEMDPSAKVAGEVQAANNGAGPAQGLVLDAQHLGTLMRRDRTLRLGFLSAGGWDTHANQGNATGALAQNLANLAQALVQLRQDFSQAGDVVLVASEFGRTSAENGTRGTDHGHGNALWLLGDMVHGGQWHGRWEGLATGNLHEGRDLPVHHDFRAVLAQVVRRNLQVDASGLDRLFPGFAWDSTLDSLMRS